MFDEEFKKIQEKFPYKQRVMLKLDWRDKKAGLEGRVTGYYTPPDCLVVVRFENGDEEKISGEEIESLLEKDRRTRDKNGKIIKWGSKVKVETKTGVKEGTVKYFARIGEEGFPVMKLPDDVLETIYTNLEKIEVI